jgi:hypothetical protein
VSGQVTLEWITPAANGSPITSYLVTRDVGSGVFFKVYQGASNSHTDKGLVAGKSYTYKIAAITAAG